MSRHTLLVVVLFGLLALTIGYGHQVVNALMPTPSIWTRPWISPVEDAQDEFLEQHGGLHGDAQNKVFTIRGDYRGPSARQPIARFTRSRGMRWVVHICGRTELLYTYDSFRAGLRLSDRGWKELQTGCGSADARRGPLPLDLQWDGQECPPLGKMGQGAQYGCPWAKSRPNW